MKCWCGGSSTPSLPERCFVTVLVRWFKHPIAACTRNAAQYQRATAGGMCALNTAQLFSKRTGTSETKISDKEWITKSSDKEWIAGRVFWNAWLSSSHLPLSSRIERIEDKILCHVAEGACFPFPQGTAFTYITARLQGEALFENEPLNPSRLSWSWRRRP